MRCDRPQKVFSGLGIEHAVDEVQRFSGLGRPGCQRLPCSGVVTTIQPEAPVRGQEVDQGPLTKLLEACQPARLLDPTPLRLLARGQRTQASRRSKRQHRVLPLVGGAVSGHPTAYRYLPESVERFPECDELAARMSRAGFVNVEWTSLTFGIAALHVGERPVSVTAVEPAFAA